MINFFPCVLKPFPLQGTDNNLSSLVIFGKSLAAAGRVWTICIDVKLRLGF